MVLRQTCLKMSREAARLRACATAGPFEEHDSGGDADVERCYALGSGSGSRHGDADQEVALLGHMFMETVAFAAEDDGDGVVLEISGLILIQVYNIFKLMTQIPLNG